MTSSNENSRPPRRPSRRHRVVNPETRRANVWTSVRFPRLCKFVIILLLIVASGFLILASWLVASRSFGKSCMKIVLTFVL